MEKKNISVETIEKWLEDERWVVRQAAMLACQGRKDIPIEVIEKGLEDEDRDVRRAAMKLCKVRTDTPLSLIEKGLEDESWEVQREAARACKGRTDIPIEAIEKWMEDEDCLVRYAAMLACQGRKDLPLKRTIEPNKNVYKKCLGGVIVVATIPSNAQVRGKIDGKCRASEAIITDVIGDEVGISWYNNDVKYRVGDHVIIDDFDYSDEECSIGFHFFNTIEEAEKYKF